MANTYSDLTATSVANNYMKSSPSSQFGTRALRFVKVTIGGAGAPDLTKGADGSTGSYTDANSVWTVLTRTLQGYVEIYESFIPSATVALFLVADDTAQDSDTGTNVSGGYGDAEQNIYDALGAYNGVLGTNVVITTVSITSGVTIG